MFQQLKHKEKKPLHKEKKMNSYINFAFEANLSKAAAPSKKLTNTCKTACQCEIPNSSCLYSIQDWMNVFLLTAELGSSQSE